MITKTNTNAIIVLDYRGIVVAAGGHITCEGTKRGSCGQQHHTAEEAMACITRDVRSLQSPGAEIFGIYGTLSDRRGVLYSGGTAVAHYVRYLKATGRWGGSWEVIKPVATHRIEANHVAPIAAD